MRPGSLPVRVQQARLKMHSERVLKQVERMSMPRLLKCGNMVARDARKNMHHSDHGEPSAPGEPPHVQTGVLQASINAVVQAGQVVVQAWAKVGVKQWYYGEIHEYGGTKHPKRPFLKPALARMKAKFAEQFKRIDVGSEAVYQEQWRK